LLLGLTWTVGWHAGEKTLWKPVDFAIVKFNGEAPKIVEHVSHGKEGAPVGGTSGSAILLLDMKEQEVHELDPQT